MTKVFATGNYLETEMEVCLVCGRKYSIVISRLCVLPYFCYPQFWFSFCLSVFVPHKAEMEMEVCHVFAHESNSVISPF